MKRETATRVGPYRVAEELGSGGMGEVYRAYDERLRRWVAIKQLRSDVITDAKVRQRFRREARAAASLNHPSIVQIYDILEDVEGHDWIVMELVEGTNLKQMTNSGPLSLELAIRLGREICEGLALAHDRGIIHRDLKVENVMVTSSGGAAKILDFGLAKDFEHGADPSTLSSKNQLLGTSRTMSPEQIMGLNLEPRSDLFSLGTLLFEALTGESPFKASNSILTLARVCSHQQPPVSDLNPKVPEKLSELIDSLLEKEPDDRPADAREVAAMLSEIAGNERETPEQTLQWLEHGPRRLAGVEQEVPIFEVGREDVAPLARPRRPRHAWQRWLAVAAVTAVVAVAALVWNWQERGTRPSVAVLGFKHSSPEVHLGLSATLAELLSTELGVSGGLRVIPSATVAQMKRELEIVETEGLAKDTLVQIGKTLGTDYVVVGNFLVFGAEQRQVQFYPVLQSTVTGKTMATWSLRRPEADLLQLVSETAELVRGRLDVSLDEDLP